MSSTEKTEKVKSGIVIKIISIIFMITTLYLLILYKNTITNSETYEQKLKETIESLTESNSKISNMQSMLEGIKTNDDLLKRDIFLYIDRKFQIIPNIISLEVSKQILKKSKENNISPELLVGIIEVESGFNPMAISNKNARGLMQIMPEWVPKFKLKKVSDLHDIDTNIECGIKVLKIHIKESKGSITKGLYYYVGKSESYAGKVYEAMGKFVAFRSTLDDKDSKEEIYEESRIENEEDKNISGIVEGTKNDNR